MCIRDRFIFLFDPNQGTTLYGTRHVLCHLFWRYDLTAEQLFYMVNISLKYFVALPVAILFISATNPSEFAASLKDVYKRQEQGYTLLEAGMFGFYAPEDGHMPCIVVTEPQPATKIVFKIPVKG